MRTGKFLVYFLFFTILFQNGNFLVCEIWKEFSGTSKSLSLLAGNTDTPFSEEDSEEGEKDSNENKEKEKEFKNIKHLYSFLFLPFLISTKPSRCAEASRLCSLDFETETPPPKFMFI